MISGVLTDILTYSFRLLVLPVVIQVSAVDIVLETAGLLGMISARRVYLRRKDADDSTISRFTSKIVVVYLCGSEPNFFLNETVGSDIHVITPQQIPCEVAFAQKLLRESTKPF